ncbi:unnamed protein product [Cylindrotheca closterium]|uniref:RxLR effector protein n=1 Tax=Cylindrotheca closterium TaxID=2856 RepID=A0AAD2CUQ0_9STRA|nr:unnamed protein product [Cylindrotheca closterium]
MILTRVLVILALCLADTNALTAKPRVDSSRRSFLVISPIVIFGASLPAIANDVENLSMSAATEQSEEEKMTERLRRKAELQKKASKPASFADSLAAEKKKKDELKKSKEERRNALCEELGRGC